MLTTVIGAYPKPDYLKLTDWFKTEGGTDTLHPTKLYNSEIHNLGPNYEIIFQNKQINPLKLKLPSGKKLKGNELKRYISEMKIIYANHLNLLFE